MKNNQELFNELYNSLELQPIVEADFKEWVASHEFHSSETATTLTAHTAASIKGALDGANNREV